MKEWIEFILKINLSLDKLCGELDDKAEKVAMSMEKSALKAFEEIDCLYGKKVKLINLRVLFYLLSEKLSPEDLLYLDYGKEFPEISRFSLSRKRSRIFNKAIRILSLNGYDEERLNKDYPQYSAAIRKAAKNINKHQRALSSRSVFLGLENRANITITAGTLSNKI